MCMWLEHGHHTLSPQCHKSEQLHEDMVLKLEWKKSLTQSPDLYPTEVQHSSHNIRPDVI